MNYSLAKNKPAIGVVALVAALGFAGAALAATGFGGEPEIGPANQRVSAPDSETNSATSQFRRSRAQARSTSRNWEVVPSFVVGRTVGPNDYLPPGILDGIGSTFPIDEDTVRIHITHELNSDAGYPYELENDGATLSLTGARISYFDINRKSMRVVDGGLAYHAIYDRSGDLVTDADQLGGGLGRLCSARGVRAGELSFVDNITFAGEEIDDGTQFALDVDSGELWAVPAMGLASWENVTPVDTGDPDTVGLIIGDDEAPAPLYLYIGRKNAIGDGSFLDRNGLASGQLYFLVLEDATDPEGFNGTGAMGNGVWMPIEVLNDAGEQRSAVDLRADAFANGGFHIARPEDVHENPNRPNQLVLADTGRGSLYPSDDWGTIYIIDLQFGPGGEPGDAWVLIAYDGDDAGGGQFDHPDFGIRSPDNLTWASDGFIYVQEDRATQNNTFGGESGEEASIYQLNPSSGEVIRIAQVNRAGVPFGQLDEDPTDLGDWETSGIVDVSHLFGDPKHERTILIADVQAHSLGGPPIDDQGLVEGGQLFFLMEDGRHRDRDRYGRERGRKNSWDWGR